MSTFRDTCALHTLAPAGLKVLHSRPTSAFVYTSMTRVKRAQLSTLRPVLKQTFHYWVMTVLPASASVLKGSELASRLSEWSPSAHDRWTLKDTDKSDGIRCKREGQTTSVTIKPCVVYKYTQKKNTQKHKTEPAGFEPARLATTDSEQKVSYSSLSD